MALYSVTIGKKEYRVMINHDSATVDGEKLDVELVSLNNNGLYLIKRGQQALELYLHPSAQGIIDVQIGRQRIEARVQEFQNRMRKVQGKPQDGDLRAPMPGNIVDVLVDCGQEVSEGDVMVVMESMKMKMQLRSPRTGTVAEMVILPGQDVEKGDLMMTIDQ